MQEIQRQAYLENLGLTPWVARRPLPGAAESRMLARPAAPEPAPADEPVPSTPPELRVPLADKLAGESTKAAPVPPTAAAEAGQETALRFTLHALATPTLLLVIQQADAEAPEPGRDEQRLLASLLRYLNARGAKPRPFA